MDIKSKKDVDPSKYKDGYIFPCEKKCLVTSACSLYCYLVFDYMNFIADSIYEMDADQIEAYRKSTPACIKRKIQDFYTNGKRLAYPETCTVSRDWK